MVAKDAELVRTITELVVNMLQERGLVAAPAPADTTAPVARPAAPRPAPLRRPSAPSAEKRPGPRAAKWTESVPSGKVFLTAEAIENRLGDSEKEGMVELAPNEFLTPNAADWVEARHLKIRRSPAGWLQEPSNAAGSPGGGPALTASAPSACPMPAAGGIGVVTAKADAKVSVLLEALAREKVALINCNRGDCWIANLLSMCREVSAGGLSAGVAIVPHAAEALLLAAKVKGAFPVQGISLDGVARALRKFGANVVVLEPASSTYHQMRMMIRLLAGGTTTAPEASPVVSALKELEG